MLRPNPWNPNVMTPEMMAKERASIREFGFVDPITVREEGGPDGGWWQIIDGEQRFNAGVAEGMEEFPIVPLDVTEDEAKELTIILNDTRGQFQEGRLSELVQDLAQRREQARMESLLPYTKERLDQLANRREVDWSELEQRRDEQDDKKERDTEAWVERVYRMPKASAEVVDEAVQRVQDEEDIDQQWRALEMIAADFLAG
jgi:ParB-like chromosome segregation protein Spo0J